MFRKVVLTILIATVLIIGTLALLLYFQLNNTFLDYPMEVKEEVETIEVGYVNWACDCADHFEIKLYDKNVEYHLEGEDCIYIEPLNENIQIPETYYDSLHLKNYLRLKGQFYKKKGISRSYERKTSEKPEYARVFRYASFDLMDKKKEEKQENKFQFIDSSFESFYHRFITDTTFQKSRIQFPLKGNYQTYELERDWTLEKWPLMQWDFREGLNSQDDSISIVQNNKRFFYGAYCIDCGFSFEMEFSKIKEEWLLTLRQENNF